MRTFLALAMVFGASASVAAQETEEKPKQIVVEVVDVDKAPVEGAFVATMAEIGEDARRYAAKDQTEWFYHGLKRSDAQGRIHLEDKRSFTKGICVLARHEQRKIVAIASIDANDSQPVRLTLVPECEVSGEVRYDGLIPRRPRQRLLIHVRQGQRNALKGVFVEPAFRIPLPPGEFEFEVYGPMTYHLKRSITVAEHASTQQVDAFALTTTKLALLAGRPAPEISDVVAWKNTGPLKLVDLRGKYVLLEFWGYWCPPCISQMPKLFRLYDKYHDKGLVILGVHVDLGTDENEPVDSVDTLDQRLGGARTELWNGRDIPFPVAIVTGRKSTFGPGIEQQALSAAAAAFGVIEYPTQVLIDPEGNVVQNYRGPEQLPSLLRDNR